MAFSKIFSQMLNVYVKIQVGRLGTSQPLFVYNPITSHWTRDILEQFISLKLLQQNNSIQSNYLNKTDYITLFVQIE